MITLKEVLRSKRNRVLIVVLVGLIIMLGLGVYIVTNRDSGRITDLDTDAASVITDSDLQQANERIAKNENINDAYSLYEKRISEANSSEKKAEELMKASAGLSSPQGTDEMKKKSLEYALKAEELHQTPQSAAAVAAAYQLVGDTENENKFYAIIEQRSRQNEGR